MRASEWVACRQCDYEYPSAALTDGVCELCRQAEAQVGDAMALLDNPHEGQPRWSSPKLNNIIGPLLPGITLVCARPGSGKTTLMLNTVRSLVWEQGVPVIYCGMETSPATFRLQLAALTLRYPWESVIHNNWSVLPTGARSNLQAEMKKQLASGRSLLTLPPDPRLTPHQLLEWIEVAKGMQVPIIMVDHLHEMDWGGGVGQETAAMAQGLRRIREAVAEWGGRLLAAAQLRRPGGFDVLEEYVVPPLSAIKQSGAAEEVARMVLMLHRSLRDNVTEGDLKLARAGRLHLSEVVEEGTMSINIAKARENGALKGKEIRLYIGDNWLYDRREDRDGSGAWTPIHREER